MKVGMVLEGGAMRGMFTAGVLDVMLDHDIKVDEIIGVSAGALFGPNYFSKQRGRVIRYSTRFAKDKRYISFRNLVLTGNIVGKRFAYYKVTQKLDKFDTEEFKKNNSGFWAVATDVSSGEAKYFKINDVIEDMEKLRASSSVPLVSRMVKINGKKYLDGAIADSIPIDKFIKEDFDKIIVVLTRPLDYCKEPLSEKQIKALTAKYHKYPEFLKALISRPERYNKTLEHIKDLEQKQEIFVIRPSCSIDIPMIERDKNKLLEVYNLGVNDCLDNIDRLKKYLEI